MPPIKGLEKIIDGFRINTSHKGVIEMDKSRLPPNIKNKSAQEIENWINVWLDNQLKHQINDANDPRTGEYDYDFYAKVHVLSTNPLDIICVCGNNQIPDNWWVG